MAALTIQAEAFAFRQLVEHLQWRTDVPNIELMNLAGFCRNCLSKWYLAGAQTYGLSMGYEDACRHVYGEPYVDWKKRHQPAATEEQMRAFKDGAPKHARTHVGPVLAVPAHQAAPAGGMHSSVCGQRCDPAAAPEQPAPAVRGADLDASGPSAARFCVLTCSDRASRGVYQDGSGPAVAEMLAEFSARSGQLHADVVRREVVPDERAEITDRLRAWSSARVCDCIVTTGGTGLGPRDVTPEATRDVLEREAEGLARGLAWRTSHVEPHSVLSRGVCGITAEGVLVVNLPGNPAAVRQCMAVLLPLLPQALRALRAEVGPAGAAVGG